MGLEQAAVGVAPDARPADREAGLREQRGDHRDVHVVEVDLATAEPAGVRAPVCPETADDARPEGVRGLVEGVGRRMHDRPVRQRDGAHAGERGGERGADRPGRERECG